MNLLGQRKLKMLKAYIIHNFTLGLNIITKSNETNNIKLNLNN